MYEFVYLGNRQINIEGRDYADIDDCFRILIEVFSIEWLETQGENIIKILWNNPFVNYTNELYALGYAIRNLIKIDKGFIDDKVKLIKTDDPKNWNGALFEIIALNLFVAEYNVIPAKENQPGYDGIINLDDNKSVRLSIKNFSISKHQENYNSQCVHLAQLTEQNISQFDCIPLEVIINKKGNYPTSTDWNELFQNYPGAFIAYNEKGTDFLCMNIGEWSIIIQKLLPQDGFLSSVVKSYTLIVSAPFHANEEKNLFDKLEEACVNLSKHEETETDNIKNFVIIHLSHFANRNNCEQWVKDYLGEFQEKPISGVILLQPLVLKNEKENEAYISIGFSVIGREKLFQDYVGVLPFKLASPIGKLESGFPQHKINLRETETTGFEIILENCYFFQKGHHYYDAEINERGEEVGSIDKVASGIFRHTIFHLLGSPIELSGQFEPIDKLFIL